MKIQNKTHWRTDQLRAFISRIAKDELDGSWRRKMKYLRVEIVYTRPGLYRTEEHRGGSSGCATLGGTWMCIRLAKVNPDKIDIAHTIAHEMAHLRGLQHSMMREDPRYSRVGNWRERYAWALDIPLELPQPKVKPNPVEIRARKAEGALKTWERKLKLARTKVKQYERKVRYYSQRDALKIAAQKPEATAL